MTSWILPVMQRGHPATERWTARLAARLAICVGLSLAVHVGPLVLARRLPALQPIRFDMRVHVVEIGLDSPRAGDAHARPAPPSQPPLARQTPTSPSAASTDDDVRRARPQAHRAARSPSDPNDELPLAPLPNQLREPALTLHRRTPRLVDPSTGMLERDTPPAPRPAPNPAQGLVPLPSTAAANLVPFVPRGALVTVVVRGDHVRNNPNANSVRRLLSGIPDWDAMLGGTDLDPLRDLDEIVLASSRPMTTDGHAPDWFVLARAAQHDSNVLRRAIEQMARQRPLAPSPVAPPPRNSGPPRITASPDIDRPTRALRAGERDGGLPSIWAQHAGGGEVATFERYGARRSFVLLGDGLAAIAMPDQVDRLMAAMSRRGPALQDAADPRVVLVLEAEGVRNLIEFPTMRGPFPMPRRMSAVLYQQRDAAGAPTGAAELISVLQYDTSAQAQNADEMLQYSRGRWHAMIDERAGQRGGFGRLLAGAFAGLVGIDLDAIETAIDAMNSRIEQDRLVVRADLNERQVRAILNAAALGR